MNRLAALLTLSLLGSSPAPTPIRGMRHPALSPDGREIAFDFHGDIWICPAEGGVARRATEDPADERKPAWSPDGGSLAFASDRNGKRDLYVLDLRTRVARQLTFHSSHDDAPAWSPDGKWIAFQSDRDSNLDLCLNDAVADVWRMPAGGGTATRVTRFRGENPAWSPDGKWIAYDRYASGYSDGEHNIFLIAADGAGLPRELASGGEDSRRPTWKGGALYFAHEANGIQFSRHHNVWRTAASGGALVQVTGHRGDHVTWPTTSEKSDLLVYEYDFDLYAIDLRERAPKPRRLAVAIERAYEDPAHPRTFTSGFRAPAWSPSGKEIAFACRGGLWVAPVEGGEARALAGGPDENRDPSWSADGRRVVFCSNPWGGPGHVYATDAGGGLPVRVTRRAGDYRAPRLSPDGARIAVSRTEEGETDLRLVDLATGVERDAAAERDVEEAFGCFSPDGRSLAWLATRAGRSDVVVLPLAGGEPRTLKTESTLKAGLAWSPDGTKLAYAARAGAGGWAAKVLEADGSAERTAAAGAQAPSWSPDGSMLVCELEPRGPAARRSPAADGATLTIFDAAGPQTLPVPIRVVKPVSRRDEMRDVFLQVWGTYSNNYYDPFFHGVDMPALRAKYASLAADCQTKPELYDLVNDMIRELRSSHIQLRPPAPSENVVTGSLAADLARGEDGSLRVARVEAGGPADQAGLKPGEILVAAGETELGPHADLDRLLTGDASAGIPEVKLTVRDAKGATREVAVRGIARAALRELKYENQTAWRKRLVRERSAGRLAYFHIRAMTQTEVARLRTAIEKEFPGAEALVLDERDGVGGLAHRPICSLLDSTAADRLNRDPACFTRTRSGAGTPDRYGPGPGGGRHAGKSWDRPVVMIQNEISRSDKEILPHTFRHLGIGYLVGMPTAGGVIGGSEWTLQDGSRITVSMQGWFTAAGRNMEGWGVPPDFRVPETHEDLHAGRDAQLEKAVEVVMGQLDGRIAAPKRSGIENKAEGNNGK